MHFSSTKEKNEYFEKLYDTHSKLAFAHAYRVHKNRERSLDTVNDAFLKIWKALDSIKDPDKIAAYIVVATRHTALNNEELWKKKTGRDISREDAYTELEESVFVPSPASLVEIEEDIAHIRSLINELDYKYSNVLILNLWNGLTPEEIAGLLGCPVKTVYTRLNRGKKIIKKKLEEERSRFK